MQCYFPDVPGFKQSLIGAAKHRSLPCCFLGPLAAVSTGIEDDEDLCDRS